MIEHLDIDRLHHVTHHVLNGTTSQLPRKSGCTTAYLHLMLGEVWIYRGPEKYVYIGNNPTESFLDFVGLLATNEIEIDGLYSTPCPTIQLINGQVFQFWTKEQSCDTNFWIGANFAKIFFDEDMYVLDTNNRHGLLNNIHFSGAVLI